MTTPTNPFPGPGTFPGMGAYDPPGAPAPAPPTRGRKKGAGRPADGAEKTITRRVISRQVKIALAFAVVLGILGFLLLTTSATPGTYVARASQAAPALATLTPDQVEVVAISEDLVQEGALAGSNEADVKAELDALIAGSRTLRPLPKGAQLSVSDFSAAPAQAAQLGPNERLVSVPAAVSSAAAGAVQPGDRVDVYGTTGDGAGAIAGLLVADVPVFSVAPPDATLTAAAQEQASAENRDKSGSQLLPTKPIPGTYVLRLNELDVARVLSVVRGGDLVLALRPNGASTAGSLPADAVASVCGTNAAAPPLGLLPPACNGS